MGQKLNPNELALYRAVDEVLHYLWDPIGVSGNPHARDEYQSYLPQVYGMLRDGSTQREIAAYLNRTATERMGLPANTKRDLEIADILLEWKEMSDAQDV